MSLWRRVGWDWANTKTLPHILVEKDEDRVRRSGTKKFL